MSVKGSQSICASTIFAQGRLASSESRVEYCKKTAWMVESTFSPVRVLAAVAFFHVLTTGGFSSVPRQLSFASVALTSCFFCLYVLLAGILVGLVKL